MKIGVSSYSFSKYMDASGASYIDICDIAKKIGFDGIEFIDLDLKRQNAPDTITLAKKIRRHCDEIGLPVVAYTVGADFLKNGSEEVERIKRQVDIAEILGAGVLRHDASWASPDAKDWREIIAEISPLVREVTEYACAKGIKTCTENHGYNLQDSNRVEALIQAVNHPNYGWLVDMGNFLCADEPAVHAMPIAAKYAVHAHAKDFLYRMPWEENPGKGWFPSRSGGHLRGTVLGCGVVPLPWCVKVLKEAGYDKWLSLEFEGMEDCLPAIEAGYEYLRNLTKE